MRPTREARGVIELAARERITWTEIDMRGEIGHGRAKARAVVSGRLKIVEVIEYARAMMRRHGIEAARVNVGVYGTRGHGPDAPTREAWPGERDMLAEYRDAIGEAGLLEVGLSIEWRNFR